MGRRLAVVEDMAVRLGVLAPERLERRHEAGHVEAVRRGPWNVGDGLEHARLLVARQVAPDDFGVHSVGRHKHAFFLAQQPQVEDKPVILVFDRNATVRTGKQRLDDAPDARFAQTFHETVHMRVATADNRLLCGDDVLGRNGRGVVRVVDFDDTFTGEGVDQPGLAARELPDIGESFRFEDLSRCRRVLRVEGGDFLFAEVAQHQVFRDDVKRADLPERFAIGTDLRLVVADIEHPDEGD